MNASPDPALDQRARHERESIWDKILAQHDDGARLCAAEHDRKLVGFVATGPSRDPEQPRSAPSPSTDATCLITPELPLDQLSAGIRIFRASPSNDLEPWLALSSGAELVQDAAAHGVPFIPSAVVPREDWRPPSAHELGLLICPTVAEASAAPGMVVAILEMPEAVMQPLRSIALPESAPVQGTPVNTADADAAIGRALEYLAPYIESTEDFVIHGVRVQRSPVVTATTHSMSGGLSFIGMHVDRWHHGDYGCGVHSQFSVNLGNRDRFFTFVNLPVHVLKDHYGDPVEGWLTIGRDFVAKNGGYPLVRLRLRPGEAYLAPTENLIHDVSLSGSPLPDICFNLRGRFHLPT